MMLCRWESLPKNMQNDEVRPYYDSLRDKKLSLFMKAIFDRTVAFIMLIVLLPVFILLALLIKVDSPGEDFFPAGTRYQIWA